MNHEAIATAMCGRYVKVAEQTGYLESNMLFPEDGRVIGAYVVPAPNGQLRICDDGDTLFRLAVSGAEITRNRARRYQLIAQRFGVQLDDAGELYITARADALPTAVAQYLQAASAIATLGVEHRPKDSERFERLIGTVLDRQFAGRVSRRVSITGISGHQLQFPFAIDLVAKANRRPAVIQTISADDDRLKWRSIYEAGGKFADVASARSDYRLVAILERAADADRARRYFADKADVIVYEGGDLQLEAA